MEKQQAEMVYNKSPWKFHIPSCGEIEEGEIVQAPIISSEGVKTSTESFINSEEFRAFGKSIEELGVGKFSENDGVGMSVLVKFPKPIGDEATEIRRYQNYLKIKTGVLSLLKSLRLQNYCYDSSLGEEFGLQFEEFRNTEDEYFGKIDFLLESEIETVSEILVGFNLRELKERHK